MNQEYFDYIAVEIDNELEREAVRRISTKEYADKKSEQLDKFLMKCYPSKEESEEEAVAIVTKLMDVLKKIMEKNDDFNTNMLAFVSFYNYIKYKKILDKVEIQIIESLSDVFIEKWEKKFFLDLLYALNSLDESDFIKMEKEYPPLEITYMCLSVIFLHKILDYRIEENAEDYDKLAYYISKIGSELRVALFYGYNYKDPVPFDIRKCIRTGHYKICLPKLYERNRDDLEGDYEAGDNENVSFSVWLERCDMYRGTLHNRLTIVNYEIWYDKVRNLICKAGNYMSELENKYRELKILQDERYRIIRDFSHTYENMQAIGLKEIANILMESNDSQIRQCGRVILAEYGMKDSLKAEVNLLRLNFEDKRDDIMQLIRKGIRSEKSDSAINIYDIFEEALKICLLRIIYSGNPRGEDQVAKAMYKRIKSKAGSMKEFVQNFESEVIVNGTSIVRFLESEGIKIEFYSDDAWNKLYFEKNKHAEVLIRSIFAELVTNSFKYANLDDVIIYSMKLRDNIYGILQSNTYAELMSTESGIGLESKGEILKKINGYESYVVDKTFDELRGGKFTALFLLDYNLFNTQEDGKNE